MKSDCNYITMTLRDRRCFPCQINKTRLQISRNHSYELLEYRELYTFIRNRLLLFNADYSPPPPKKKVCIQCMIVSRTIQISVHNYILQLSHEFHIVCFDNCSFDPSIKTHISHCLFIVVNTYAIFMISTAL